MSKNKVIVIGATGLVGCQLVKQLIIDSTISEVHCLVRQNIKSDNKKVIYHKVDFGKLRKYDYLFKDISAVLCCIGTTIKKAKNKENFKFVDLIIPKNIAQTAKFEGVKTFSIVSSIGANKNGSSFYLKVKGEIEDILQSIGFERLIIYRPSLLLGDRKEFRLSEAIMTPFFKIFNFLLPKKLQATESLVLAKMMQQDLNSLTNDIHIIEADKIK